MSHDCVHEWRLIDEVFQRIPPPDTNVEGLTYRDLERLSVSSVKRRWYCVHCRRIDTLSGPS